VLTVMSDDAGAAAAGTGRRVRLASPAAALVLGIVLLMLVVLAGVFSAAASRPLVSGADFILLYLAFGVVGVVVAWHQPANPIGWVLLGVGVFFTLGGAAGAYTVLDYRVHHGALPLGWLAVLTQPGWAPAVVLAGLSLLLFPDGRFPSRRWRPLMWAYIVVGGLWVAGTWIISVGAIVTHHVRIASNGDLSALDNPAGTAAAWGIVGTVFFALIAVSWLAWLTSQVLSYRRISGERREQLKWLLSGATVFIVGTVASVWLNNATGLWKVVGNITGVAMFALPVSIGFGILKFKLYDIDRIISRTLAYAIVTGLLVGVYAGLVLLATQALPFPLSNSVAVAGATLVAAALFSPLRRRVQRVVDRRFNRARYDADAAIAAFAAGLQDAVDLEAVRADLLGTVRQALEPAHASVWITGGAP
jgi:hypothetical protein